MPQTPCSCPHLQPSWTKFPVGFVFTPPVENNQVYSNCIQEYCVWSHAWVVGSNGQKQLVPGFGGFVSTTGSKPCQTSTIEYFTPSTNPLLSSMPWILLTLVAAWRPTHSYGISQISIRRMWSLLSHSTLGWTTCACWLGLTSWFRLQEITTEAELVTSGCLENILRAKEYAKALFYLKTVSKLQNGCWLRDSLKRRKFRSPTPWPCSILSRLAAVRN